MNTAWRDDFEAPTKGTGPCKSVFRVGVVLVFCCVGKTGSISSCGSRCILYISCPGKGDNCRIRRLHFGLGLNGTVKTGRKSGLTSAPIMGLTSVFDFSLHRYRRKAIPKTNTKTDITTRMAIVHQGSPSSSSSASEGPSPSYKNRKCARHKYINIYTSIFMFLSK